MQTAKIGSFIVTQSARDVRRLAAAINLCCSNHRPSHCKECLQNCDVCQHRCVLFLSALEEMKGLDALLCFCVHACCFAMEWKAFTSRLKRVHVVLRYIGPMPLNQKALLGIGSAIFPALVHILHLQYTFYVPQTQSGSGAAARRKGSVEKLMRSCKSDAETTYLVEAFFRFVEIQVGLRIHTAFSFK